MPSRKSADLNNGSSCRKTWCTWSLKFSFMPMRIMRLAACTANGALAAISAARLRADSATSSAGTTLETKPMDRHSSAFSVRPEKTSSAAFDQPSRRGRIQVPPDSGSTPRAVKAAESLAASDMMRMSQPSAKSMP